jgi:hypothetical protein
MALILCYVHIDVDRNAFLSLQEFSFMSFSLESKEQKNENIYQCRY